MSKAKDGEWGLTVERLKEILCYNPETGTFIWLKTLSYRNTAGNKAGELKPNGYVLIGIDGHRYRAHRLAWLYMTGDWPVDQVDHIDNVRHNNTWTNLRAATNQTNQANSKKSKNNTSGYKGVYWSDIHEKWAAKINVNYRQIHLGFYSDPAVASFAYEMAAKKYFGEFARIE